MLRVSRPRAATVTQRNTRRAYERLFGSDRLLSDYLSPDRLRFYDEVAEIAATFEASRVVDVGCGSGELLRALAQRRPSAARYVGVDHARTAVKRAREMFPEATWIAADLYALEPGTVPGAPFELVLCTEVLEHLREPRAALAALLRIAAPGGHILVTVPDGAVDEWRGHENFWTEDEFGEFLAPFGLEAIRRVDRGAVLLGVMAVEP